MSASKDLIAFCGLYCGACSFKVAYDTNNRVHLNFMPEKYAEYKDAEIQFCPGCRLDNHHSGCKIRACAIEKGFSYCSECPDMPCEYLEKFSNDGIPHHKESIKNLEMLKKLGEEKWLTKQQKYWTCSCGNKLSWYFKNCRKCHSLTPPF